MNEALGLVEIIGLSTAILVADAMVKTANVHILELENTKGSGYMTVKIAGNIGAVTAAVTSGKQIALENNGLVSSKVIPRPSKDIEVAFCQPKKKKDNDKLNEKQIINKENDLENCDENSSEINKDIEKLECKSEVKKEVKTENLEYKLQVEKESIEIEVEENHIKQEKLEDAADQLKDIKIEEKKAKKNGRKKNEHPKK
ncbi:BMC domain-containing protein [uncultured Clostridium sp.]|uniref:BMC domain-containing protein n=1 Tax=uncultured Clostridium sp. TaxID=59620 RepID=UPI0028E27535|nr:BMC domain-containing protein [uncultured Clostridium sp.]